MSEPGVCDTENVTDHGFVTTGKEQVDFNYLKQWSPTFWLQ